MNIYKFKNPKTYVQILKMVLLIRKIKPDIIHTFFPTSNILGVLAGKLAGVAVSVSSRRDFGLWMNSISLFLTKYVNKHVTRILVNSYNLRHFTHEKEKVPLDKIDVLYNGVKLSKYNFPLSSNISLKKELTIPKYNKIVGNVANLRPIKHLETLLLAAAEVLKKRSDVNFIFIGRGPSETSLKLFAKKLGIDKNVIFAGSQEDVTSYLSIFDIGVNCSALEGFSNAIIEYMSCGVPAIVSDAGGNTELIEHGINGFVFPVDNYKMLASQITDLLNEDELSTLFKKNARKKVEILLSLDKIISQYEDYYTDLVDKSSTK